MDLEERWLVLSLPGHVGQGDVWRMAPELVAEAELDVRTLSAASVADVGADPRTLALAPEMPVSLIHPQPSGAEDNLGSDAWGLDVVGVTGDTPRGTGMRVAVLDTGIDAAHPAFAGLDVTEKDFTGSGNGDASGHGTHCAGVIAGRDVGVRIGVLRGLPELLIGKVLDGAGGGTTAGVVDGIYWATASGAHIISLSLGFDTPRYIKRLVDSGWAQEPAFSKGLEAYSRNLRLFDTIMASLRNQREIGRGPLVVAAAGNQSRRQDDASFRLATSLPASAMGVISVGALQSDGGFLKVADFSNINPIVVAPGSGVLSAWPGGGLKSLDGTSMACPLVAGVAALWWQSLGVQATADLVAAKLKASASTVGLAPGFDFADIGLGLVQAPS